MPPAIFSRNYCPFVSQPAVHLQRCDVLHTRRCMPWGAGHLRGWLHRRRCKKRPSNGTPAHASAPPHVTKRTRAQRHSHLHSAVTDLVSHDHSHTATRTTTDAATVTQKRKRTKTHTHTHTHTHKCSHELPHIPLFSPHHLSIPQPHTTHYPILNPSPRLGPKASHQPQP